MRGSGDERQGRREKMGIGKGQWWGERVLGMDDGQEGQEGIMERE